MGPDGTLLGERRHKDELDSGDDSDHGRDQDDVSLALIVEKPSLMCLSRDIKGSDTYAIHIYNDKQNYFLVLNKSYWKKNLYTAFIQDKNKDELVKKIGLQVQGIFL